MDRLSEYVDDELPSADRLALEAHLGSCAECSALLADLRRVVARAGALEPSTPARDLWPDIAARIGAGSAASSRVVPLSARREKRWSFSLPQLAAAAVLLMTVSGGTVWLLQAPAGTPAGTATTAANPTAIHASATATQSYAAAVADLERVLAEGRNQLDTATVRVIQQNLIAIDNAIAQAQKALSSDPANLYLNTHLAETMRRKLDLLRQAATLVHAS
jgi:anti-sigma factor RsiW